MGMINAMAKENNILLRLDGLEESLDDSLDRDVITDAVQLIESQQQQIELLKQNNDLKDEIIKKAREAYKELNDKVAKMLTEIGAL